MSWFVFTLLNVGIEVPNIFVETGAYKGKGIQDILNENRFTEIHSIELSPKWADFCKKKFETFGHVHIHEGDSAIVLEQMISQNILPNKPILFYLDAHFSGGETAGIDRDNGCPVLRELQALSKRNVKGDIIFVDDMRLMGKGSWSGIHGSDEYPFTYFDFRHVTIENMEKALQPRKINRKEMCRGFDRMMFVLD